MKALRALATVPALSRRTALRLGFDAYGALYVSGPANGATPEDGANPGAGWLARVEMDGTGVDAMAATPTCTSMATPAA